MILARKKSGGVVTMSRSIKAFGVAVASASVLLVALPGVAMASGTGCGDDPFNIAECTQVIGTGLKVTSIAGQVKNFTNSTILVEVNISGPNGHITNTAFFDVNSGGVTPWKTWHNPNPNANMTPGDYCTQAISPNGTVYSQDCIEVHT
jgi:hypothetical protein